MSQTEQTQTTVPTTECRECGATAKAIGANRIGRPVYECANGHTQAGPFP